jgi:hypothetical protein
MVNDPYLYRIWAGHPAKKRVLVSHNLEHDLWRVGKLRSFWARPLVRRIEESAGRRSDLILACGPEDARFYRNLLGEHRSTIEVPNGVFLSDYPRLDPMERHELRAQMGFSPRDLLVLFVASKYGPNFEALGLLQRLVREQKDLFGRGRLTFVVVGSVASRQDSRSGLMCVGQVPNILPYLQTADFAINPVTTGGGTNVKMFDYLAAGLPILTTAFGKRGLDLNDGEDCIVFDQDNLASSLADLLSRRDHGTWRAMAVRALEKNAPRIDMAAAMRSLLDFRGHFLV